MSGTILYRDITDLCGNHQRKILNNIANNNAVIDIPKRFDSNKKELNTFSLSDSQSFLNANLNEDLPKKEAFVPYNQNYMNFVTYDDISFQKTG